MRNDWDKIDKVKVALILVLIAVNVFFALSVSGCGIVQRTTDWIFVPSDKIDGKTPETSKDALWQTVKKAKDNLFTSLAIPIIALGAAVMYLGFKKLGMACVIFGAVNLIMALASARFAFWMALFGFIGTAIALAASILAKNRVLKDLVFGIQKVKAIIPETDNRLKDAKIILAKQTTLTKKFVKKIKDKAKLKGEMFGN